MDETFWQGAVGRPESLAGGIICKENENEMDDATVSHYLRVGAITCGQYWLLDDRVTVCTFSERQAKSLSVSGIFVVRV